MENWVSRVSPSRHTGRGSVKPKLQNPNEHGSLAYLVRGREGMRQAGARRWEHQRSLCKAALMQQRGADLP